MARTDRRPVVVLVTSGTAAMELGPAVVEAAYARVPLIVLTADRPAELRDRGAPQTIDQDHLYGEQAKWFAELPLFDGDPATRPTCDRWRVERWRPRSPGLRVPCTSTCRSASRCCRTDRWADERRRVPFATRRRRPPNAR